MISERMLNRLDNLVAKYSYQDYYAAQKKRRRRIDCYSLSGRTNEAREMRNLAQKRERITLEEEERVKAYLTQKIMLGELDDIRQAECSGEKYNPMKEVR